MGQFSQAIPKVRGHSAYGLWLDERGKVQADGFVISVAENDFLVVSYDTTGEILRKRFEDFIVADDVTVSDETEKWARFSLWGEGTKSFLKTFAGRDLVLGKSETVFFPNGCAFHSHLGDDRGLELLVENSAVGAVIESLRACGFSGVDRDEAEFYRISEGRVSVPRDIGPADLPQESELGDTAVSYAKGCYIGQEVMSRLKHLGTPRRRLFVVAGEGPAPAPGAKVFQQGKVVGEVRTSASSGNRSVAMAMLTLRQFDPALPLALDVSGDRPCSVLRTA